MAGAILKRERVRDYLLELIETQPPGAALPAERVLCTRLAVSRPTLRSAVDELVTTGMLIRQHGRGTFVAPAKITQELVPDAHALAAPPAAGTWTSRVLEFATVPAGALVGRRLRISPAAEIVSVARQRLVDGAPIAVEYLHVPVAAAPGLTAADLESGFHQFLRRHGVLVHDAVQSVEPTVTNDAEADLLGVPVLSPALLFERLTNDDTGRPVEYVRSLYRGDRYRIVSRLALVPAAAPGPAGRADHHPGIPPGDLTARGVLRAATVGDVR